MILAISNSDGDCSHQLFENLEALQEYYEFNNPEVRSQRCIYGPELLEKQWDSNYWPENALVVLDLKDPK